MSTPHSNPEEWPLIYSYTRQNAIDDGVLIDLSEWSAETGFCIPVACTHTVWSDCITPPPGSDDRGQSLRGRAHDLLWMLFLACRCSKGSRLGFQVILLQADGQSFRQETVELKAVIGPGDQGEPVLTVMYPHED